MTLAQFFGKLKSFLELLAVAADDYKIGVGICFASVFCKSRNKSVKTFFNRESCNVDEFFAVAVKDGFKLA